MSVMSTIFKNVFLTTNTT